MLPLGPEDSLFPTHRDLSAQIAKGLDLKRVMAQFWGRIDGYTRGRDGNSHIGDWYGNKTWTVMSHLPIAYPVAVGAAWAYKLRGEPHVAIAICGDGATSNGRWHECLNWSAIFALPVVWVVNNNLYAYSTPNELEFPVPTIAERGEAYGMPGRAGRRCRRAGGGGGGTRGGGTGPLAAWALADRVGVAPVEGARGPRPRQVHAEGAARGVHEEPGPREELRARSCCRRASSTEQDVADDPGADRAGVRRGVRVRAGVAVPRAGGRTKGVWVEDGYWTSEPGRGGGPSGVTA